MQVAVWSWHDYLQHGLVLVMVLSNVATPCHEHEHAHACLQLRSADKNSPADELVNRALPNVLVSM